MCLVEEFEGIVSVGEVLLGLCLYLCVCRNAVKKFGAVLHVFGIRRLIRLKIFIMTHFFFKCSFVTPAKGPHKIIATDESHDVQHSPTNHNRNTCHLLEKIYFHTFNYRDQSPRYQSLRYQRLRF